MSTVLVSTVCARLINGTGDDDIGDGINDTEEEVEEEVEEVLMDENGTLLEPPFLNYKRQWNFAGGWLQAWNYTFDEDIYQIKRNGTNGTLNVTNVTKNPLDYPPPLGPERDSRGVLLHYNRIVGGLRLSQECSAQIQSKKRNYYIT
eukprot:6130716-Amphidinium_carterae.1